ncbi:DUF1883 domain-containing protein [Rhodococcus sp. IEGM 1330]|uniref:DUF1883 domain-containing protein n=1 Tax=Rhodococcus sp. IEGM 1330 TaxID=3082225 RepID=UPI002954246A|nr:DUF1883 domain-containing protein [Rhodococcus sp. IEGM 1330]MDV8022200.1 DUF1883 domain-containing protein [Rhodococcus sp. IEGM 1330]
MNFNSWDLGQQSRGAIVEVTLSGNAANVRLLDGSNYRAFQAGKRHRFTGGHATRSPVRLQIPSSGHWHVVVDYGGLPGRGRAGVQVLPGQLPALRRRDVPPLDSLSASVADLNHADGELVVKEWDVFVSHAHEDKEDVVRPLAYALQKHGLRVWYDETEMRIGDSLRRKIDQGIAKSAFGIVVLSAPFFAKNWTQYELDGLVTRSVSGEQVLLPLWHKITKAEVMAQSPTLADKVARSTTDSTLEEIAAEIAAVISSATESTI